MNTEINKNSEERTSKSISRKEKIKKILFSLTPVLFIVILGMTFYSGYCYKTIELYKTETSDYNFVTNLVKDNYILNEYNEEVADYNAINAYLDTIGDKYATYS